MGQAGVARGRASSRTLVGRLEELALLEHRFQEVAESATSTVVFLEGPAGIGKSRLVHELAERVEARGGSVLEGRCVADGAGVLPYAPLVELLDTLVRAAGAATVTGWAGGLAAELSRLVPGLQGGGEALDTTRASASRLFQALRAVLDGAAERQPRVVVVEDLQWADHSTRELLTLLVQQVRGPVLFLVTLRSDEAPHDSGISRFVAETGRRSEQHVVLRPLTRDEQARQVSDILGVPPTSELLDEIYLRAEGNPFFAEELLVVAGRGELPPTLRDLLLLRLENLEPATRQVLRIAAVIGRQVPHHLLERVADVTGARLEDALRDALRAHVLEVDAQDDGYRFRHALLHEAVAATLLPGEAVRMHRRLAEVITAMADGAGVGDGAGGVGGVAAVPFARGRAAVHWLAAGETSRAFVASLEAAREAKQSLAFAEALNHVERALSLLEDQPQLQPLVDEPRYWLLWSAAEVAHLAGYPYRAAELVRSAIEVVDEDAPAHHGYLYERLGRYLWMAADGVGALAAYERAVALVPVEPPTRWRAAVLSGYSQILMLASRFREARHWAEQAIEVARELPDGRSVEGHARCNLGVALARLGDLDAGVAELREAHRVAVSQFDDVDDIARALVNLQSVYADAGRLTEAVDVGYEAVAVVDDLGLQRRKGVWCRCAAAHALLLLGRFEEARFMVDQARDLLPQGVDAMVTDLRDGELLLRTGRVDEARKRLESARSAGSQLLDGQLIGPLYAALVEVADWAGDHAAAQEYAEEGAARLQEDEDAAHAVPLFAAAASAVARQARVPPSRRSDASRPAAPPAARWLERSGRSLACTAGEAPLAAALDRSARCEAAAVEGAATEQHWHLCVEAWASVGDPFREASARLRLAEWLLSPPGGRDDARAQLAGARDLAERIGAVGLVRRCDQLATRARLRLTDPIRVTGPEQEVAFRLTPREREVLGLVAEGLSDREIGARLFISHRTVERHVSNLLAKLDASRRSQLTATAHRAGLLEPR